MKQTIILLTALVSSIQLGSVSSQAQGSQPNFIIIFCDDLGYNDIGPFGSTKHQTPNLDRMAEEGRRFTDFYVTSGVCTPSRASLMTGCYPKRVGLDQSERGQWVLFPGNKRGLNSDEITIAEILKKRGYATACIGKWHLGDQPEYLPTRHGFDYYFGIPYSNDMGDRNGAGEVVTNRGYPPLPLMRNEQILLTEPNQDHLTRDYTREAIKFIREKQHRPFFLYLPHSMPHAPQAASAKFRDKSANGIWGDSVEEIDWSTGEILNVLQELDLTEKTMVVFLSDNGGATRWGASNAPLRGGKGSVWEGGQRVPFVAWWPGTIPAGSQCTELATSMDLLPSIARLAGNRGSLNRMIDGKDIRPLLLDQPEATTPHDAFFYYHRGDLRAVRSGDWKLHLSRTQPAQGQNQSREIPAQLYNLAEDVAESHNVAIENQELVMSLLLRAAACRDDLGDGDYLGMNTRPAGHVENAVKLWKR